MQQCRLSDYMIFPLCFLCSLLYFKKKLTPWKSQLWTQWLSFGSLGCLWGCVRTLCCKLYIMVNFPSLFSKPGCHWHHFSGVLRPLHRHTLSPPWMDLRQLHVQICCLSAAGKMMNRLILPQPFQPYFVTLHNCSEKGKKKFSCINLKEMWGERWPPININVFVFLAFCLLVLEDLHNLKLRLAIFPSASKTGRKI